MKAAPSIGFDCHRSPSLLVATAAVAVLALAAVWISGLEGWLRVLLLLLVLAITGRGIGKLLRPKLRSLLWRVDGVVELHLRDGASGRSCEVQGVVTGVRVLGPLIVLALRWPPRGQATLWLLPDNLDPDTHRRLRVRLGASGHKLQPSGNADSG